MKKFLKVFIVVLLVLAVIGVTCYFFFKRVEEKNNTTEPLATMIYSEEKIKFNQDLSAMSNLVNSDGTDQRIQLLIKTNSNLDDIFKVVSSYYINQNTQINNEQISKALKQVKSSRNLLVSMMKEYNIKKESDYFNRHLGANDFYQETCNYLVKYATLTNLINSTLNVDRMADVKFNMFEVYTNIVISTFKETNASVVGDSGWVMVNNANNINIINTYFRMQNSYILTDCNLFDKTISNFNKYYSISNRTKFAGDLSFNINNVSTASGTNEEIATYYFKLMYGI